MTHLGVDDGIGWLTAYDELDEIELGVRADLWMTNYSFPLIYTYERDRIRGTVGVIVGSIAAVATHLGRPFPANWWPPSAGPCPSELG